MSDINYTPGYTPASVLMNCTGDAMDNIFDVLITWPWDSSSSVEAAASYRCSDFKVPEPKTKTYDVTWHGVAVKKVASGVDLSRELSLTFRLDANYALYNKFITWKKITSDVNTSGVANTASALGIIRVVAPGSEYNTQNWSVGSSTESTLLLADGSSSTALNASMIYWTFNDCQAVEVGQPQFKNNATGTAMTYTVKFIFGDVAYPFYDKPTS